MEPVTIISASWLAALAVLQVRDRLRRRLDRRRWVQFVQMSHREL